jgi:hypothetical protein
MVVRSTDFLKFYYLFFHLKFFSIISDFPQKDLALTLWILRPYDVLKFIYMGIDMDVAFF